MANQVVVMAQWRRRAEQPATQLIEFNPHDWRSSGYVGRYCEDTPRERWRQARMDWAMAHRGSMALGGDVIDLLFEEFED
jgi:hypothetical protein